MGSNYERESQKAYRKKYNKNSYYGPTAGKYEPKIWTTDEEKYIMFSHKSDRQLSDIMHRSVGSIQKRRCRINKEGRWWLKGKTPVKKVSQPKKGNI